MIDHISIAVRDLAASVAFYERVLEPLGLRRVAAYEGRVGFGKTYPEFWLNQRAGLPAVPVDTGCHYCLRARDAAAVREFHAAALGAGGRSDGEPGPRRGAMTAYYGAFIRDLDGNKIEVANFPRPL
jgi:catechol 2,3-dioxygenase-like lactoylglutathione lyase family enzyme